MSLLLKILIIIAVILIVAAIVLYFLGKRMDKKQAEQQEIINQNRQQISMMIIDKKKIRAKDADLPESMKKEIPWYMKRAKLPMVKAKVGPQYMTLVAEDKIYEELPLNREIKATVSGLYITSYRDIRKGSKKKPEEEKKKGFFSRFRKKSK